MSSRMLRCVALDHPHDKASKHLSNAYQYLRDHTARHPRRHPDILNNKIIIIRGATGSDEPWPA
jgi:hypothetical protein